MKKISALIALLLVAALVLSGCGKKDAAKDALSAVKERGKLIVALEGNWKPWSYHGDNDALTGYDVEVARLIASKIGVEAEIVEGEWSGLFAGVDAGRYDVVVNGVEVTDERAEKYTFSEPYGYIRTALIVRDDNEEIKTFEDLKGKSTANSIASTYMNLAESYGATCSGVETLDETLEMVLQGRVDATLNADVSFYDYMSQHPDAALKVVALTEDANLVSIPMAKTDATAPLAEAINKAIADARASGELKALSEQFFGADISSAS